MAKVVMSTTQTQPKPPTQNATNGESMSSAAESQGSGSRQFQSTSLSSARSTLLSTADALHVQKLTLDRHIIEASELLELLFLELAEACAVLPPSEQHPLAKRHAYFSRKLEEPLNQCAELCQRILEADKKFSELFGEFLLTRKGMAELVLATARNNRESSAVHELYGGCEVYPLGKAREVLREVSVADVREVCEGSVRRGRALRGEMGKLLEGVERFMMPAC